MASEIQPRGTSVRTPAKRPKLMRASATCPQLATSNASRNDLANRQCWGATTILTRVATYSGARRDHALSTSPNSTLSSPELRSPESASLDARKEPFEVVIQRCGNYYSFPSFEGFQDYLEDEERSDHGHDDCVS
ncbi:hypothetical protein OIDMADRAFT_21259 [Oidiodendron maius Zn]|uniref:Uncharacterized protein n=1 Tax=Oidiodendron maius (strain Zn) TaxID=913774 RepID=A0A0C3CZ98_OIDMZ|nr:hypothetical protein OIDMADRAFT_21259 [Oidiodendron maius Zn]